MKQQTKRTHLLLGIAALSLAMAFAGAAAVNHADAQRRLRATLYITQQTIPRGMSEAALLRWARGHSTKAMTETTSEEIAHRHWRGRLIISFSRPPGDLEFHAIFYDVEDGARDLLDDMSIYVGDPDQETYVQNIDLERPRFRPNRHYEMVVTVHHEEVGRLRFETRGEEIRHSGRVDFTDEE